MLKSNQIKLRWIGIIVIGVIFSGMQPFVGDEVWAQDPDQDLVFTPVDPCRIHDSRKNCEVCGPFNKGTRREYYVYGDREKIFVRQGGKEIGCPSPQGEPAAVHINVTAVPILGNGYFTVYPANAALPNASLVNYIAGVQNIANAATIKCYFNESEGAREIAVMNRGRDGRSDLVIDVMGYYYPHDCSVE